MKAKQIFTLMLALALVFSLAACGGNGGGATATPTTAPTAAPTAAPAAEAPVEEISVGGLTTLPLNLPFDYSFDGAPIDKFAAVDMGGIEIRIGATWDTGSSPSGGTYCYSLPEPPSPATNSPMTVAMWANAQRIMAKYNVKLVAEIVSGDYITMLALSTMSGDAPCEILWFGDNYAYGVANNDLAYTYDQMLPSNADIINAQIFTYQPNPVAGKKFMLGYRAANSGVPMLLVNLDVINQSGAANPIDLYKAGQWTWANFLDVAKKCTVSTDGTGVINQWGLGGVSFWLLPAFVASNGGKLMDPATNKHTFNSAPVLEAFQFYQDLYLTEQVGFYVIDEDSGLMLVDDWNNGFNGYYNGNIAMSQTWHWDPQAANISFNYGFVPMPLGPSNPGKGTYYAGDSSFIIPAKAQNPQILYQIWEEMQYWWKGDEDLMNSERYDFLTTFCPTMDDAQRFLDAYAECVVEPMIPMIPGGGQGWETMANPLIQDRQSPAAVIEARDQVIQSWIDNATIPLDFSTLEAP